MLFDIFFKKTSMIERAPMKGLLRRKVGGQKRLNLDGKKKEKKGKKCWKIAKEG